MNEARPTPEVRPAAAMPLDTARRWLAPLFAIPTPVIFVGAAVLATAVLWRQGSLGTVGVALHAVSPWRLVAILCGYALSILLLGVRWHTLVRLAGGDPAWAQSTDVFLTSVIVNYAAPIGLAVPTRAALTVRDLGLSKLQSGLVVGWELVLDVVALLTFSMTWMALGGGVVIAPTGVGSSEAAVIVALGLLCCAGMFVTWRAPRVRQRLALVLAPLARQPRRQPAIALLAVLLTGVYWSTQLGVMAALTAIFGAPASPALILGLMGLPVLIGMLSPIPGGAGVREALMVTVARFAGVATGPVLLAAIAYRLALFAVTPVVWGAVRLATARNAGRRTTSRQRPAGD